MSEQPEQELEFKAVTTMAEQDILFDALYPHRVGVMGRKERDRHYFDTPDYALHNSPLRIAWRTQFNTGKGVRAGGYSQTLKYEINPGAKMAAGLAFRSESKSKINSLLPDFQRLSQKDRDLLAPYMAPDTPLEYKFTAAVPRRYFNLKAGRRKGRALVEVAFDRGFIFIPSLNLLDPVVGIELESADPAAIMAVRDRMAEILGAPLKPDPHPSKAAQGMALHKNNIMNKK